MNVIGLMCGVVIPIVSCGILYFVIFYFYRKEKKEVKKKRLSLTEGALLERGDMNEEDKSSV